MSPFLYESRCYNLAKNERVMRKDGVVSRKTGVTFEEYAKKMRSGGSGGRARERKRAAQSVVSTHKITSFEDVAREVKQEEEKLRRGPHPHNSVGLNFEEFSKRYRNAPDEESYAWPGYSDTDSCVGEYGDDTVSHTLPTSEKVMRLVYELTLCNKKCDAFGCIVFLAHLIKADAEMVIVGEDSDAFIGCDQLINSVVDHVKSRSPTTASTPHTNAGDNDDTVNRSVFCGVADAIAGVLIWSSMCNGMDDEASGHYTRQWLVDECNFITGFRFGGVVDGCDGSYVKHVAQNSESILRGDPLSVMMNEVVDGVRMLHRLLCLHQQGRDSYENSENGMREKNTKIVERKIAMRITQWGG